MKLRNSIFLLSLLTCSCAPTKLNTQAMRFSKESLIEGSEIQLVEIGHRPGEVPYYTLSTGQDVTETKLSLIREVASKFDHQKAEIARRLLDLDLRKDEIDHVYFVSFYSNSFWIGNDIRPYITLDETATNLRFTAR